MDEKLVIKGYEYAKEVYAGRGVDVDKAIEAMKGVPISMNCWQADDVLGFDGDDSAVGRYCRPPAIIRAARALRTNCAPTPIRR